MTFGEFFKRERERAVARANTPEAIAQAARNDERFRKEEAARLAWEAANPPDPHEMGRNSACRHDEREPPEDMTPEQQQEWLNGFDSEQPLGDDE